MSETIELRGFNYPEELQDQRKLFIECFPENIGTPVTGEHHYQWKFKSFPSENLKPAYEYVAVEGDDLIAYYAAIPYPYKIGNKNVNAAMVCDVMTGVKARGKGVFTKLGVYSTEQFAAEGLAFSTGYPIRPEVIPGHKKAGWEFPFEIPMYGKFLKLNSFLKSRGNGILSLPANFILGLYNLFHRPLFASGFRLKIEVFTGADLDLINGLDDFFESYKSGKSIVLDKSVKFLKWRLNAPDKKYNIIVLRKDSAIVGYTVLREVEKEGVPCIGVLDYCMLNDYQKYSGRLIGAIEKLAKSNGVELLLSMMMKQQAKHYGLRKLGFLKTPYPFSFIIKQFDKSIDSSLLTNESNWSLMWIDSDDL